MLKYIYVKPFKHDKCWNGKWVPYRRYLTYWITGTCSPEKRNIFRRPRTPFSLSRVRLLRDSVWAESRACTLHSCQEYYTNIDCVQARLSAHYRLAHQPLQYQADLREREEGGGLHGLLYIFLFSGDVYQENIVAEPTPETAPALVTQKSRQSSLLALGASSIRY